MSKRSEYIQNVFVLRIIRLKNTKELQFAIKNRIL